MAEARLRFGSQSSADVRLFLTSPGEEEYVRNPVHLHSQILKRFKYFERSFSNRRSSDKSTEIRVTTSHNFDHYLKCIEIMYGEHVDFPNIEECLAILSVASEMPADEGINKCMQYLEAVRWSAEESQIRKVLSSDGLKLKILPDLALRLHHDGDHLNLVEEIIEEMVLLIIIRIRDPGLSGNKERVEKYLEGILHRNTSRDVVDVCGRVLLKHFESLVDCRYLSTLLPVFKLIQYCNGGILEAALKAFCENAEFVESVKNKYYKLKHTAIPVFDIIMWFMKATGDGKIIISRASRVSFLTTWLPIIGTFTMHESIGDEFEEVDKAVLKVVESLPQVDQKRICLMWAGVYRENAINIATPYTLAELLLV